MLKNGQTNFKNLAVGMFGHFSTLCIKGLHTYFCWDTLTIFDHYYLILHIPQNKGVITKISKTFRNFQVSKKNVANN